MADTTGIGFTGPIFTILETAVGRA